MLSGQIRTFGGLGYAINMGNMLFHSLLLADLVRVLVFRVK